MKSFEEIHGEMLGVLTENAYTEKRKEISANTKLTSIEKASALARAASEVATDYTKKYQKFISAGSLAHIHNLTVVSARAQASNITAAHNYKESDPGYKVHIDAAIGHQKVLDFCKNSITKK